MKIISQNNINAENVYKLWQTKDWDKMIKLDINNYNWFFTLFDLFPYDINKLQIYWLNTLPKHILIKIYSITLKYQKQ